MLSNLSSAWAAPFSYMRSKNSNTGKENMSFLDVSDERCSTDDESSQSLSTLASSDRDSFSDENENSNCSTRPRKVAIVRPLQMRNTNTLVDQSPRIRNDSPSPRYHWRSSVSNNRKMLRFEIDENDHILEHIIPYDADPSRDNSKDIYMNSTESKLIQQNALDTADAIVAQCYDLVHGVEAVFHNHCGSKKTKRASRRRNNIKNSLSDDSFTTLSTCSMNTSQSTIMTSSSSSQMMNNSFEQNGDEDEVEPWVLENMFHWSASDGRGLEVMCSDVFLGEKAFVMDNILDYQEYLYSVDSSTEETQQLLSGRMIRLSVQAKEFALQLGSADAAVAHRIYTEDSASYKT